MRGAGTGGGWHENNQALLANNANARGDIVRGSIRRGGALLSGASVVAVAAVDC